MIVNQYSKRIFNMSYQFTGNYPEAEDLTQEIFLKLYNTLPKYDFEKDFTDAKVKAILRPKDKREGTIKDIVYWEEV